MADIDLKTETPDTTLPTTGFLFGADSQAAASPSVFTVQSVATTLLGSTTLTGATVTTSSPVIDAAQTWNDGGTTFTGLRFNATDTASASGSLLMNLQVGGSSKFTVTKGGEIGWVSSISFSSAPGLTSATNINLYGLVLSSTASVTWRSGGLGSAQDLFLFRRAAANLRFGAADAAAPVAQTLSVQSVVAGTTDTAGANLTITGSQGTGTGAGGSIIFQVAPAGSSGTAQNALVDALTINSTLLATFAGSILVPNGGRISRQAGFGGIVFGAANEITIGASGGVFIGPSGARLYSDAANILALRDSTAAQAFRVYNTFTSATDFERANIFWDSNALKIGTEKGSAGGTARALEFQTDGVTRFTISASANLLTAGGSGGTLDLGSIGVLRTPYINNANNAISMFVFVSDSTGTATFASNGSAPLMRFGGTTSSFPALKRSSASLQVRLADDSGDANLTAAALTLSGNLTISTKDIVTDGTTGTKIGTATTQKIGFYNATPVVQPTAVADATDAATVITQLNALLAHMRTLGLIAT